jgi:transcription antitermination factor NusG
MLAHASGAADWFAAQVWTGREHQSVRHLRSRGYEVFLPCYRERREWSDRAKQIERPLFAGYLFCRMPHDVVGRILTAPGVIRILGDGSRPLPIASDEVEAIQRVVDTGATAAPCPFVRVGQRVRIDSGPLRGTEGIVMKANNRDRLVLSVSLLQRSVAVEIVGGWVSVATAASA